MPKHLRPPTLCTIETRIRAEALSIMFRRRKFPDEESPNKTSVHGHQTRFPASAFIYVPHLMLRIVPVNSLFLSIGRAERESVE